MSEDKQINPIIYRYLGSHWYETLRDAEFLASSPTRFNDLLDCAASTTGHVPEAEIDKYLKEHDWFRVFHEIAQEKGLPVVDTILNVLNSGYINKENLRMDERLKDSLRSREPLSRAWRIVCFSMLPEDSVERRITERRMWKRYANKDRGVRIGFDFSRCTCDPQSGILRRVVYQDHEAIVDLSKASLEPRIILDYARIVLIKRRLWESEHEVRLITTPNCCIVRQNKDSDNELCFWKFNREIVREVCLGLRFPQNQVRGLIKMIKNHYPNDVKILRATRRRLMDAYQYEEVA